MVQNAAYVRNFYIDRRLGEMVHDLYFELYDLGMKYGSKLIENAGGNQLVDIIDGLEHILTVPEVTDAVDLTWGDIKNKNNGFLRISIVGNNLVTSCPQRNPHSLTLYQHPYYSELNYCVMFDERSPLNREFDDQNPRTPWLDTVINSMQGDNTYSELWTLAKGLLMDKGYVPRLKQITGISRVFKGRGVNFKRYELTSTSNRGRAECIDIYINEVHQLMINDQFPFMLWPGNGFPMFILDDLRLMNG